MKKILETLRRKWAEYLLEILVIVIGILGAFSLESWNERKNERKQEKIILQSLQSEFEKNQELLEEVIANHWSIADGCKNFVALCKPNPEPISEDSLRILVKAIIWVPIYTPDKGAINSVISSGNISLIRNNRLKYLLNSWTGKMDLYKYGTNLIHDGVMNDIKPLVNKYYPIENLQLKSSADPLPTGVGDVSLFEYDQNLLFSDMELASNVEYKRSDSELALKRSNEIKVLQEDILSLIRDELGNR